MEPDNEPVNEPDSTVGSRGEEKSCCCPCECVPKWTIDLLMWRDVKKTAPVFVGGLILLTMLMCMSLISVVAYCGLIALACAAIGKVVVKFAPKVAESCPFVLCMCGGSGEEQKCEITSEKAQRFVDAALPHLNAMIARGHEVFVLNNPVETAKFALVFWILTYIGDWFNLLTLVTMLFCLAFTAPRVYEQFQPQFDALGAQLKVHLEKAWKVAGAKIDELKDKMAKKKTQ